MWTVGLSFGPRLCFPELKARRCRVWLSGSLLRRGVAPALGSDQGVQTTEANQASLPAVVDGAGDFRFQAGAGDDAVDEAVLEEELAGLETFGEFQADGSLDSARAGEADEGFGFGEDQVAERGEAGRDAAHGG